MSERLRVILCDDSADLRDVVRSTLERASDLRVVGEAGDVPGAIALAERELPDAIVLDLSMPGGDAATLIPAVRSRVPGAGLVLYSGQGPRSTRPLLDEHPEVLHVPKASPSGRLVDAVRAAAVS
ncbi:MAG TPA: response regulator transcription factor [Solirubrobacteraceae bacterium]